MTASRALSYEVEAYNISHASENKIHDDAIARKLGFTGGLVPGVEMYAYMTHPVVEAWGRDWLERGTLECRFAKPLYDGRTAVATAVPAGSGLDLRLESDGVECATGHATLGAKLAPPALDSYPLATPPAERPAASETSLAKGTPLGIAPNRMTNDVATAYLGDIKERHAVYAREGLVHPGLLLRLMNLSLRENVVVSPWIHAGSKVRNFATARVGDEMTVRARIVDNYERKGHRLVDIDGIVVANGRTVVAHVLHTAVWRLRQLAA